MAGKKTVASSNKIQFGKRKGGKASKTSGPKDKNKKPYRGQGK